MKDLFKRRVARLFALFGFVPEEELFASREKSRVLAEQAIKLIDGLLDSSTPPSAEQRAVLEEAKFTIFRIIARDLPQFSLV